MIICIIIVVILFVFFVLINKAYKSTNAYYNQFYSHWDFKTKRIEKIVILGSTYSRFAFEGLKYLRIGNNNLTLNSQSVEDSYKNLKRIEKKLNKNIIFLSLAPCTLLYDAKGHFNLPGTTKAKLIQKIKFLIPVTNPKKIMKIVFDDGKYQDVYDSRMQVGSRDEAEQNMEKLMEVWNNTLKINNLMGNQIDHVSMKRIDKNVQFLNKIADICHNKGCSLYFVIPPFSSILNSHFSNEFIEKVLLTPLKKFIEDHNSVIMLDFRNNEDFQDYYSFLDGGFVLNRNGSINFIRKLNVVLNLKLNNKLWGIDCLDNDK